MDHRPAHHSVVGYVVPIYNIIMLYRHHIYDIIVRVRIQTSRVYYIIYYYYL